MNERADIAERIERSRIALLRLVISWLMAALVFAGMQAISSIRTRRLPRRLAAFVDELIVKAEQATFCLLIALLHQNAGVRRVPCVETVRNVIAANRIITLRHLTIGGVIRRLEALHALLQNLHAFAENLAKAIAARARIVALNLTAPGLSTLHAPFRLNAPRLHNATGPP